MIGPGTIARRLRRLVKDAEKAGYKLIADADASAIRVLSAEPRTREDAQAECDRANEPIAERRILALAALDWHRANDRPPSTPHK